MTPGTFAAADARIRPVPAATAGADPLVNLNEHEIRTLHQVNQRRTARGLSRVGRIQNCQDAGAERWAQRLTGLRVKRHRRMSPILSRCRLRWVGEVIAWGGGMTPQAAVRAWMASPAHRRVIMSPRARLAGIGTRRARNGQIVLVLTVGQRR